MKLPMMMFALFFLVPGAGAQDSMPGMKMAEHEGMPGMHRQPAPAAQRSASHDTLQLQEPEAPEQRTGRNVPAPELLEDVSTRPARGLAEFLAMAERLNPTAAQANAAARRSAALALQAGLYPNPEVGYQGEQIRGGSYAGGEHGAYVQQTIVLGGKLGARRDVYQQQRKVDEFGVDVQKLRVRGDVTLAFYAALTAQSMVAARRDMMNVAREAVDTSHRLANVGQADAPDILQAEVEYEAAKVQYVAAQRVLLQRLQVLAALAGDRSMTISPLAGDLDKPPQVETADALAKADDSPVVRRALQEITVAEARLKSAQREVVPDVTLRAGEQYNFELVREKPNVAAGPQSFASAGVTLPLWNRNQGNREAAKVEVERARADVLRTRLALQRQMAPLVQEYETARFTADRYREELLPRAGRAYELNRKKYEGMAQAYPQVLMSQRTLFQLRVAYLEALGEVWSRSVALEYFGLSGGLDSASADGGPRVQ